MEEPKLNIKTQEKPKKKKRYKTSKFPEKIQLVLSLLVEQGYFQKQKDIINIALLNYFKDNGFFEVVRRIEKDE